MEKTGTGTVFLPTAAPPLLEKLYLSPFLYSNASSDFLTDSTTAKRYSGACSGVHRTHGETGTGTVFLLPQRRPRLKNCTCPRFSTPTLLQTSSRIRRRRKDTQRLLRSPSLAWRNGDRYSFSTTAAPPSLEKLYLSPFLYSNASSDFLTDSTTAEKILNACSELPSLAWRNGDRYSFSTTAAPPSLEKLYLSPFLYSNASSDFPHGFDDG